jgi:hypothetical protein
MAGVISLICILALSLIVTRVAAVALALTGLSREAARFQARSAFTGVGFTTSEAETVVNHPVRRKIIMVLMLLGNAGIASAMASLLLTFLGGEPSGRSWYLRLIALLAGILGVWGVAMSRWVDAWFSRGIAAGLSRWTRLNVRDYASLLHLSGDYEINELSIRETDWIADRTLAECALRKEGIMVLGITRSDGGYVGAPTGTTRVGAGDTLVVYGRGAALRQVDERMRGPAGEAQHAEAIQRQQKVQQQQDREEARRMGR